MKLLDLNISLEGLDISKADEKKTPKELAVAVIKNLIVAHYQQDNRRGMPELDRRLFYKLCDDLDAVVKSETETVVNLEDDRFGMIRKCFKETAFIPNDLVRRVEEAVNATKQR